MIELLNAVLYAAAYYVVMGIFRAIVWVLDAFEALRRRKGFDMTAGWKVTPELNKFWFTMGEIAFMQGFSVEESCPYHKESMPYLQFYAGWNFARVDSEVKEGLPTCPDGHGRLITESEIMFCPVCKFTVAR
jgi:hypothetical protein